MAKLTEERVREIVREETKKTVNINITLDGKTIAKAIGQTLTDQIRLKAGERL